MNQLCFAGAADRSLTEEAELFGKKRYVSWFHRLFSGEEPFSESGTCVKEVLNPPKTRILISSLFLVSVSP